MGLDGMGWPAAEHAGHGAPPEGKVVCRLASHRRASTPGNDTRPRTDRVRGLVASGRGGYPCSTQGQAQFRPASNSGIIRNATSVSPANVCRFVTPDAVAPGRYPPMFHPYTGTVRGT